MLFKPFYRPSIKSASIIMRMCVVTALAALAVWYTAPALRSAPWAGEGLLTLMLFAAVMGAWHDGHAIGEKKGRDSGSALILILIAIVLFAGLTAALNQGSRTSTGMLSDQQARLYAMEIIAYGNSIKQAVQKLQIQGISESDLSFENDVFTHENGTLISPASTYPACATNSCKVFHPEGGAVQARYPPAESTQPPKGSTWKSGVWADRVGIIDDIGTDAPDIVMTANYLKREVCIQINNILNVENPNGSPPKINVMVGYYPTHLTSMLSRTLSDGVVDNQNAYCFETSVGDFGYIVTLITR